MKCLARIRTKNRMHLLYLMRLNISNETINTYGHENKKDFLSADVSDYTLLHVTALPLAYSVLNKFT